MLQGWLPLPLGVFDGDGSAMVSLDSDRRVQLANLARRAALSKLDLQLSHHGMLLPTFSELERWSPWSCRITAGIQGLKCGFLFAILNKKVILESNVLQQ
ncbi:hypothetical protein V6N13_081328 [Hibiscus sabdariffa]|uniref:Uncharacterized protein n=1 Tax=Hibiscus sabdariffa TaxID=183260 RepID=A0ABR2DBV5_9ROSI